MTQKPKPYFGEKHVCFECIQKNGNEFKPQIVVLSNHKGFLCARCARNTKSENVKKAYSQYQKLQQLNQPWIGDLVEEILFLSGQGFRGTDLEYSNVLKHRKYNHLLIENVRIALNVLSQEKILSVDCVANFPVYYEFGAQTKDRHRKA